MDIRFAMCFPDVYEIGMSHLGIQILYHMFNERPDVWCERVYSPWPDLDARMRKDNIPLFALESQDPSTLLISWGLRSSLRCAIPISFRFWSCPGFRWRRRNVRRKIRSSSEAVPVSIIRNRLPSFFDVFYIGEGETVYDQLFDVYKKNKAEGKSRREFLEAACQIPGIYVPMFYDAEYQEDGTLHSFTRNYEKAPEMIEKQVLMDVTHAPYPKAPVVPFIKATQDRVVLEIQRGCIRGCRFCQAGMHLPADQGKRCGRTEKMGGYHAEDDRL